MYTVVVEYPSGTETYEFNSFENAVEAYKYSIEHGIIATVIDEYGNILVIK